MAPPGLTQDVVVISRPSAATDAEGTPIGPSTAVATVMGTLGMPRAKDQAIAAQRGETVDAVVALDSSVPVKLGHLVTVRGANWVVVAISDVRLHQRVLLRHS